MLRSPKNTLNLLSNVFWLSHLQHALLRICRSCLTLLICKILPDKCPLFINLHVCGYVHCTDIYEFCILISIIFIQGILPILNIFFIYAFLYALICGSFSITDLLPHSFLTSHSHIINKHQGTASPGFWTFLLS